MKQQFEFLRSFGLLVLPRRVDAKIPAVKWSDYQDGDIKDESLIAMQTMEHISGWVVLTGVRSGGLVVLDIDTHALERPFDDVVNDIQAMAPCSFMINTPSGGLHLYYRLSPELGTLRSGVDVLEKGVDIRAEGGLVVSLGSRISYKAGEKGFTEAHTGEYKLHPDGVFDTIPEMTPQLFQEIQAAQEKAAKAIERPKKDYQPSQSENERVQRHNAMPQEKQIEIVLECLEYILEDWGTQDYDLWRAMWMSAYHGSNGDETVLDFIINHPDVYWSGNDDIQEFMARWRNHTHREEEGNTVATLFYMARQRGWLSSTGYEIRGAEKIQTRYITEWLDTLPAYPELLVLTSQTGSGKTVAFQRLWEKSGKGKALIFVPTTRLAVDLASKLVEEGLPAVCYANPETLRPRESGVLDEAQILVTTAQTFMRRVLPFKSMAQYSVVYFEEAGSLVSGFVRGGSGNFWGTHVNEVEAQNFMRLMQDTLKETKYVWFVDATMTSALTSLVFGIRRIAGIERPVRVVENVKVQPKAPVIMAETMDSVLTRCAEALMQNKRVVVACDTRRQVDEVVELMRMIGVLPDNYLALNSTSAHTPEAAAFLSNADTEAEKYQLIVYNSVIGSGVSVTSVRPDLVIQFCRYLPPRQNLQILNRYRKQSQVICYYGSGENLDMPSKDELLRDARQRLDKEAGLSGFDAPTRTPLANIRADSAAIDIADEMRQSRNPAMFYAGLLEKDGRQVTVVADSIDTSRMNRVRRQLRDSQKERKEWLRQTWVNAPISITEDMIVPETLSHDEIEQGLVKGRADLLFGERLEEALEELSPEEVYDLMQDFGNKRYILKSFVSQSATLDYSLRRLADSGIAVTSFVNQLTKLNILSMIHQVMPDLSKEYSEDEFYEASEKFLSELSNRRELYDTLFTATRHKYDYVRRNYSGLDRQVKFVKNILSLVGLKLRKKKLGTTDAEGNREKGLYIANWEDAQRFVYYTTGETIESLQTEELEALKADNSQYIEEIERMSADDRANVLAFVADGMSLKNALMRSKGKVVL